MLVPITSEVDNFTTMEGHLNMLLEPQLLYVEAVATIAGKLGLGGKRRVRVSGR